MTDLAIAAEVHAGKPLTAITTALQLPRQTWARLVGREVQG